MATRCGLLLDGVAWSIGVFVCLPVGHDSEPCYATEPIEMPFGWLSQVCPRNHRSRSPNREGKFREFLRIEMRCEPLLRCTQQNSVTAAARLLQPTALLPTGRCHINFPS